MYRFVVLVMAALTAALAAASVASGQARTGATPPSSTPPGVNNPSGNAAADQIIKFGNYDGVGKRLSKQDKAKGKTVVDLLAQDKADAMAFVKLVQLSCNVTDAVLVTEGKETVDGGVVNTRTFEVACSNGMGYFLVAQQPGKPYGFTCFGADATHVADIAAKRKPSAICALPANKDMKVTASAILNSSGQNCTVRGYRWIGQSAKSSTDYIEVACDNRGFVLASPLPGSSAALKVVACHDAYLQGIPCKLSDNGAQAITLQTFKDALAQHNVRCSASDVRSVGLETVRKRHVVEFLCPEQPKGLVAFIPLEGNVAPFETVDCMAAAKRGIKCTLTN